MHLKFQRSVFRVSIQPRSDLDGPQVVGPVVKVVPGEALREIKSGIKSVTARLHSLLQGKQGVAGLQNSEK